MQKLIPIPGELTSRLKFQLHVVRLTLELIDRGNRFEDKLRFKIDRLRLTDQRFGLNIGRLRLMTGRLHI